MVAASFAINDVLPLPGSPQTTIGWLQRIVLALATNISIFYFTIHTHD